MHTIWSAVPCSLLAWLGSMALLVSLGCAEDRPEKPDLVLVTVDRLAADRLACFGGSRDAGSSLCELAQNGTLFAWATTPALDEAVAAASVLTGSPPALHGLDDRSLSFLPDHHETIAESLARAGYATAAFVASPRLNRSRRLDQGFEHYNDALASSKTNNSTGSIAQASSIQKWIENTPPPYFVWVHVQSESGLAELERLVDRLAATFERGEQGPGVLVAALAGEAEPLDASSRAPTHGKGLAGIRFRTHRVPLLWRPPSSAGPRGEGRIPSVSPHLASLLDVAPTLRAAARLPDDAPHDRGTGRNLATLDEPLTTPSGSSEAPAERFLLMQSAPGSDEVGLASGPHLYVRRPSVLDGSGRPVPTSELKTLAARFMQVQLLAESPSHFGRSAAVAPRSWRTDVLSAESPVPRLEFHLAQRLAERSPGHSSK